MDPIEQRCLRSLADLTAPVCSPAFVSTVTGGAVPGGARLDAPYWWRNVREPVRFAQAAAELVAQGARIFIEIGPQPVLQAYIHDALRQVTRLVGCCPASLGGRRRIETRSPSSLPAATWRGAISAVLRRSPARPRHRGLPAYPWQRESHWLGRTAESADIATIGYDHPLLGGRRDTAPHPTEWSSHIGPSLQHCWPITWWRGDRCPGRCFDRDRVGGGAGPLPRSGSVGSAGLRNRSPAHFRSRLAARGPVQVSALGTVNRFEIASRPRLSEEAWIVHASGRFGTAASAAAMRDAALPLGAGGARTEASALYAHAARLGLEYGPLFQTVARVDASADDARADVSLTLPEGRCVAGWHAAAAALAGWRVPGVGGARHPLAAGRRRGVAVAVWRVRLLRPGGAVPCAARLHVTRVGPRSVNADILLLDDTGATVAEALDCWFVRVALGGAESGRDARLFHTTSEPSPDPRLAGLAGTMLPAAVGPAQRSRGPAARGSVVRRRVRLVRRPRRCLRDPA